MERRRAGLGLARLPLWVVGVGAGAILAILISLTVLGSLHDPEHATDPDTPPTSEPLSPWGSDPDVEAQRNPMPIIVSREAFESDDPYAVVMSNITVINALQAEYLEPSEISDEALLSYFVDYYLAEMRNGGFSQFVYNTRWAPGIISRVRRGLHAIGAQGHAEMFDRSAALVDQLEADELQRFIESGYFGENPRRDLLSEHDDAFFTLSANEDLVALNRDWIRSRPNLRILSAEDIAAEVRQRGRDVPNRAERISEARANEPRYTKLIRDLCDAAHHELVAVTLGMPKRAPDGAMTVAWHFRTNRGHYYMMEADGQATMFDGELNQPIATISAAD